MAGVFILLVCLLTLNRASSTEYLSPVSLLQEYVRINTTTHNDLTPAVQFWTNLAARENVPINVHYMVEGYPIIVIKWAGTNSSTSSIMLNSHMDVVPASMEEGWLYPPFSATLTEDGKIYGRGTQDMKSVAIQYYEALKRLKADGVVFQRDVYMTLMPDEEIGSSNGMIPFLRSQEFAAMNVGFAMDEGTPYQLPIVALFYQDKVVWQIQVDCHGTAAHGSTFSESNTTATGKCRNVMDRMFELRDEQYEIYLRATMFNAGAYTSVNLNRMNAGTANNIVPQLASLVFDMRLGTTVVEADFEAQLRQLIAEAGNDIDLIFLGKDEQSPATIMSQDNPYYLAIANAATAMNVTLYPLVPPGSTDSRHIRSAGIPAFGFSPMPNTDLLLHAVNEHINVDTFLKGIDIYKQIIQNLANIPIGQISFDSSVYLNHTAAKKSQ